VTNDDSASDWEANFVSSHPPRDIDLDAVMENVGGEVAASWRRTTELHNLWKAHQRSKEIRLDELSGEELQAEVVAALSKTERILTETPIDDVLARHGWSEQLTNILSTRHAEIRAMVEDGRYRPNSSYSELSRELIDVIDPKTEDALQDAVYECQSLLRAVSRRSHPE
jgi:hypothetical protein